MKMDSSRLHKHHGRSIGNRLQLESKTDMQGAVLPGNSTTELRLFAVPRPTGGQVLLRMKSSTICGSDIRAIYHQHLGNGPEGYLGVIAGHEPCGQIVAIGAACRRFTVGDRVIARVAEAYARMATAAR